MAKSRYKKEAQGIAGLFHSAAENTNCLRSAKKLIYTIAENNPAALVSAYNEIQRSIAPLTFDTPEGPFPDRGVPESGIREIYETGGLIKAVRELRARTGMGLQPAVEIIKSWAAANGWNAANPVSYHNSHL